MWHGNWRDRVWSQLDRLWDLIIVGGGITGAGVLRLATSLGLQVLLVERRDFGWGTSSRSTKLVHGGLRYLAQGQLRVTRESVRERERLLQEGPGLVERLGFLVPTFDGQSPGKRSFSAGLALYGLLARKWTHRYYRRGDFQLLAPHVDSAGLKGGFRYDDAVTDDARLVLRVIREAMGSGGVALNYCAAEHLLLSDGRRIDGVVLHDLVAERSVQIRARLVVNAAGPWSDELRAGFGGKPMLRHSRGSHLVFPAWRLPVAQAITLLHPGDNRPVFVLPWEGVTVAGTTDLDHDQPLDEEPRMSPSELDYLMAALQACFRPLELQPGDAIASFAGVRPLVGAESGDPSKVSRAHRVWEERGMINVAGGKLTTFRRMALDTLRAARRVVPDFPPVSAATRILDPSDDVPLAGGALTRAAQLRLEGYYGAELANLVASARPGELDLVPQTPYRWAELRWAAGREAVVHLDDLMLRRVRIGLLLPDGGQALLPDIRDRVQVELGWDDARWEEEVAAYVQLWDRAYGVPTQSDAQAAVQMTDG
jgi:glycerol-3-phosphate dehydrogenase